MASLTVSAGAVDVYSTMPETQPLLKSSALMSVSDSGISTSAVEPSDLDDYLSYGSYSVADYFASLNQYFWGTTVPKYSGYTFITNLTDLFSDFFNSAGFYLRDDGSSSNVNYSNNIGDLVRMGFLGLSTNIKAVTSAIQALNFNDYSSILSNIYSSVDGLESGLTSANTAIGGVTTAVNNVRTAVNNVVSGLSTVNTSVGTVNTSVKSFYSLFDSRTKVPSGNYILDHNGNKIEVTKDFYMPYILSNGFAGLRTYIDSEFSFPGGYQVLGNTGVAYTSTGALPLVGILADGLNGLSRNIKGYEADNTYTSIYNDNNNSSTSSDVAGLGPMLNFHFNSLGENLSHLAYVFASDDEIKLKQDSQPIMEEVGNIYDDSDSKVKVNANGIGGVKNVVGEFGSFLEVDAGIDDVITIVTNPQSYAWLTQDTLNNLDTVGISTFSRGQSWHDRLYSEFYEEYFPERVD